MQCNWFIMALTLTGAACSNANLKKAPFLTSNTLIDESISSSDSQEAQVETTEMTPVPMPMENKVPEEKVSPPSNISGSYLICAEVKSATEASPESIVNCGLRDQKTNNKVSIESGYASKIWSYQASDSANLVVSMVELPSSLEWHIGITLKAATLAEVQAQQGSIRFFVSVMNSAGVKFQESTTVGPAFIRWLALDGGIIPTGTAIGGTENDGDDILFLCRMYAGAEVIPGKLVVHHRDSNKSNCFTTQNGSGIQSQSDNADNLLFKSDALIITQGVFDDYLEWVPSSNGLKPAQAIITGKDALGNPLYSCRNLQDDGSMLEQTPGVLRPGASSCSHEYYGAKSNSNYQVLAWKEAGTKKILDSRTPPTPTP